jgi:hypothetical protein
MRKNENNKLICMLVLRETPAFTHHIIVRCFAEALVCTGSLNFTPGQRWFTSKRKCKTVKESERK